MPPGKPCSFPAGLPWRGRPGVQYAFVPTGDDAAVGSPEWLTPPVSGKAARNDLKAAGVPYSSGHATAGFSLELTAPTGRDGYYDFYLRGIAADGTRCDLLVMLDTAVGLPDQDDGDTRRINLARLARDAGKLPGVGFTPGGAVTLTAGGVLPLGELNRRRLKRSATYTVPAAFTEEQGTRAAALGLKLSPDGTPPAPYERDGLYDMSGSQALGRLRGAEAPGRWSLTTDANGMGQLYLSAYLFGADSVTVTEVQFTYRGKSATRTAARIFCSGDLAPYFSGANAVETETVHDSALGDVLRIRAATDTNDPYVYFNAESLLATHGIRVNADEYRYMVVLVRARAGNRNGHMTFYLCAGEIGGPTEDCTVTSRLETDGKWHYCLLDLSDKQTWAGDGARLAVRHDKRARRRRRLRGLRLGAVLPHQAGGGAGRLRESAPSGHGLPQRGRACHAGRPRGARRRAGRLHAGSCRPLHAVRHRDRDGNRNGAGARNGQRVRHRNAAGSGNGYIRSDRRNGYGARDRYSRHRAGLPRSAAGACIALILPVCAALPAFRRRRTR